MIITVRDRESNSRRSYLLCLDSVIPKGALLRRAKVKAGTYAGDLIANLHEGIFRRSIELKSDYSKYYAREYGTFAEYARKRFLFPLEVVTALGLHCARSNLIIHYRSDLWFLEDNYGRDFLERLLEPKRSK